VLTGGGGVLPESENLPPGSLSGGTYFKLFTKEVKVFVDKFENSDCTTKFKIYYNLKKNNIFLTFQLGRGASPSIKKNFFFFKLLQPLFGFHCVFSVSRIPNTLEFFLNPTTPSHFFPHPPTSVLSPIFHISILTPIV